MSEDAADAVDVVMAIVCSCLCSAACALCVSLTFDPWSATSHLERLPEAAEEEPREDAAALPALDVGVAWEICRSSSTDRKLNTENLSRFTLGSPTMLELIVWEKQMVKKDNIILCDKVKSVWQENLFVTTGAFI